MIIILARHIAAVRHSVCSMIVVKARPKVRGVISSPFCFQPYRFAVYGYLHTLYQSGGSIECSLYHWYRAAGCALNAIGTFTIGAGI